MARQDLPLPATVSEIYLAAILAELQGIRKDIREWPNDSAVDLMVDGGEVNLKEPKSPKSVKVRSK